MITVQNVLDFLYSVAPAYMQEDWDNTGLLCGSRAKEVRKILVALDPFESVCREAADIGADLIVTHHPLIFSPVKDVTEDTSVGRCVLFLAENGISAINAHTNLDCAPGGVNDVLAQTLGLQNIEVVSPSGTDEQGQNWGLLRMGDVDTQPLVNFLETAKNALGCPGLRYADGGKPVSRVAVGGGACGGEYRKAAEAGCDTFVTADVKYNQFWEAKEMGLNLIDAGHFYTENPVCPVLAAKLQAAFPEITVEMSANHVDCTKFF